MNISREVKESLKTSLAMMLAYAISLQMGWDRPYWAGFAVAFCSLPSLGQSLNKATLRMWGTVMAAVVALAVLSVAVQSRWLAISLVALWCAMCTYMMSGSRNPYFWHVSGFVFTIIVIDSLPQPDTAFSIATLRLQQTALGILIYGLVSVFIWPYSTRKELRATATSVVDAQSTLVDAYTHQFLGGSANTQSKEIYGQMLAQDGQLSSLVAAATTDSLDVRDAQESWHELLKINANFNERLALWREGFRDLKALDVRKIFPQAEAFSKELCSRVQEIKAIDGGASERSNREPFAIEIDLEAIQTLSHFEQAAIATTRRDLQQLDELSLALLSTWQNLILGDATKRPAPSLKSSLPSFKPLDLERLLASAKVAVSLLIAFVLVVYIPDFPGGFSLLATAAPLAIMLFNTPQIPIKSIYAPTAYGVAFGTFFYVLVMPGLSSFLGLGTMIFVATFYLCHSFSKPEQAIGRMIGLAMFLSIISVTNTQSYNILSVTTTIQVWFILFILLGVIAQLPYSPLPEKAIFRLLKRYFSSASFLIAQPANVSTVGMQALKSAYHRQVVSSLPGTLSAWSAHLNTETLGASSTQQFPTLLHRLYALRYRIEALLEARELKHSELMREYLAEDLLEWRRNIIARLDELAKDPYSTSSIERSKVDDASHRLQSKIRDCLNENSIDTEERMNFYRILSAYRGASNALLDFIDESSHIDWQTWREERFA